MQKIAVARHAMATRFEIVLWGEDPVNLRAAGEEALEEIERLEAQLSLYRSSSELSRVNARAADHPVRVEPSFFALLRQAQRLSEETGGAFDVTIAPLIRCWGFMGGSGAMPSAEAIEEARGKVGMQWVRLREEDFTVQFAKPGMMLDLGSIGKGYALERAAELIREAGVTSALLHGGTSTVTALGAPPGAEAWKVAVELPPLGPSEAAAAMSQRDPASPDASQVLAVVSLRDEAMSVSGVHGKSFQAGGKRHGHILDPRTGQTVQGALLAAAILPSTTETDALSTALLTGGASDYDKTAAVRRGMRSLLLCERAERQGLGLECLARGIEVRREVLAVPWTGA